MLRAGGFEDQHEQGQEDTALAHLQDYLSWCAGCYQMRGEDAHMRSEDAHMLTCGGCRVARFCSAGHQMVASKSVVSRGDLLQGRHKGVCGVLGK